jgi:hypothetical protein
MTSISQGLKAGLAAGAIYAAMIGLLHLTTLLGCSSSQISYISSSKLLQSSNASATEIFYGTDIIYLPMVFGVATLVAGVIFGAVFGYLYARLPGSTSKSKGLSLGGVVFIVMALVGPDYLELYACGGSLFPYVTFALSVPAALVFGYLLGSFYDSFGRLEREETEQRREPEHWSDALRKKTPEESNHERVK